MASRAIARRSVLLGGIGAGLELMLAGGAAAQATGTRLGVPDDKQVSPLDAWVDAYGRPTAKVKLNGQGPFDFLVDTGANMTVVASRRAAQVGAPIAGVAIVNGTTGSAEMPVATIDRLSTGVVNASDLRIAILPDSALPRSDGILGADVFAGRRLTFDIQHRRVLVETSRRTFPGVRDTIIGAMRVRNGRLAEIDGHIGRVRVRLMLDTGADNCIVNRPLEAALVKAFPHMRRFERATVVGVTGQVLEGTYLSLPDVRFAGVTLRSAGAIAAEAPIFDLWDLADTPAMIVGVNVLSRLSRFTIDYGARTFEAMPLALLAQQGVRLI